MRPRTNILILLGTITCVALLASLGCSQPTHAPTDQFSDQAVITPTITDQDAATQGSQVYVYITNAPGRGGLPDPSSLTLGSEDGVSNLIDRVESDGGTIEGTDAGYAQAGFSIVINTGSTTPGQAGTTTSTASTAQSPSANPTVRPRQDIKPELTTSLPIGVAMPGGMVDQQATATGRGQTSDTNKESENDLRWAKMEATANKVDALLAALEGMGMAVPTTQPASAVSPNGQGD